MKHLITTIDFPIIHCKLLAVRARLTTSKFKHQRPKFYVIHVLVHLAIKYDYNIHDADDDYDSVNGVESLSTSKIP